MCVVMFLVIVVLKKRFVILQNQERLKRVRGG